MVVYTNQYPILSVAHNIGNIILVIFSIYMLLANKHKKKLIIGASEINVIQLGVLTAV